MAAQRSTAPFTRRGFVQGAGAATAGVFCDVGFLPAPASAGNARDPRFVVIILRGALDGLSAIPPVGDPDYAELHGELAFTSSGERAAQKLDGFFCAHPALGVFKRMYDEKHAAVIHATATGYRDRSHFDGQDVLESGYPGPGRTDSGWLNRTLGALPSSDRRSRGLGVGQTAPLVIRGPATALGWAPPGGLAPAGDDLAQRVLDLYAHRDPLLGQRLSEALAAQKVAAEGAMAQPTKGPGAGGPVEQMRSAAAGAARLLAASDGPRVAALAFFDGFDTHQNEGAAQGLLAQRLQGLDAAFDAFETDLGAAWRDTVVIAVTEFGRTARVNGTHGTDHGTGTVALLAGGALAGGRVVNDWPGLKPERLYQGRDLAPTTDLRGVLKGFLADQFGLSSKTLAEVVFPDSAGVAPMKALIA